MDSILDETSLVPCAVRAPGIRIADLAGTIRALDDLGAPRVLRSVRDAADRDIGGGRGLRGWCFDRATPREAGLLLASRLSKQPFIDGEEGLFAAAEGRCAVEAHAWNRAVLGIGLAALTDRLAVALSSAARPRGEEIEVLLTYLDEDGQREEPASVVTYATEDDVHAARGSLIEQIDRAVANGIALIERLAELFPHVLLGRQAREQLLSLTGNEIVFRQLIRHLRALDEGARLWSAGPYEPRAVTFSVESEKTLTDGKCGPMRDFATPDGFLPERWSLHTKMTGGNGARMYFRPERAHGRPVVLVGYFGPHLPLASEG